MFIRDYKDILQKYVDILRVVIISTILIFIAYVHNTTAGDIAEFLLIYHDFNVLPYN